MARGVWGLDISKSSLKAVRLESKKDSIELTDIDVIDYTLASSRDEATLEQEMRMALSLFTSRHQLKRDSVAASLPSHSTFNRFIKLPPTDPARLKDIIQYEAQQHIPFPINEVTWTYQIVDRAYQPGEEIEAVLFAIKKELIDQFLAVMSIAGVQVDIVQFAPVALYNYVMYQGALDKTGVILDMGANNTDLILVDDNKFWIRNLPIVGNDITKAIQQKFELPFPEAEKLKTSAAQSLQAGRIFTTIQPVLKDLVGEIHRSIGYYKSLSPMGKPPSFNKMAVMGNATRIIYFDEFVSQRLQMEIVRVRKLNKIEMSDKVDQTTLTPQLSSLGVALGLALQYLNQTVNRINLLPPEIMKVKRATKRKPFIAATLGILAVVLLMLYLSAGKTYSALEEVYNRSQIMTKKWRADKRELDKIKKMGNLKVRLNELVQNIPNREIWSKLFVTLNNIPALRDTILLPQGYVEKGDNETLNRLRESWGERVWILKLDAQEKYKEEKEAKKRVLELTIICGIICRKQNDLPDEMASLKFVRDRLVKPLAETFNIVVPPDPVLLRGAVGELKIGDIPGEEHEDSPDTSERKYYRFRVTLDIPL